MTAATEQKKRREYKHSGLYTLRKAVNVLGTRVLDRRFKVGRALADWRDSLMRDLGGESAVSTQQAAIIDIAVKTKLLLDSIDVWLLGQTSLVNGRKRSVFPVVLQRQQIADGLARYLAQLGLKRQAPPVKTLAELLDEADETEQPTNRIAPGQENGAEGKANPLPSDQRATAANDASNAPEIEGAHDDEVQQ